MSEKVEKTSRKRRSIEEQIADLDRKRRHGEARKAARATLDQLREHVVARCHYLALEPARTLVEQLEALVKLDGEIEDAS